MRMETKGNGGEREASARNSRFALASHSPRFGSFRLKYAKNYACSAGYGTPVGSLSNNDDDAEDDAW